jgi:hypothetical protein
MNRAFGLFALAGVVAAIAAASASVSAESFLFSIVLVASGVLAHNFVVSAEKAEFVDEESDGFASTVSRFAGITFRMAIGTLVLVCITVSALWVVGGQVG